MLIICAIIFENYFTTDTFRTQLHGCHFSYLQLQWFVLKLYNPIKWYNQNTVGRQCPSIGNLRLLSLFKFLFDYYRAVNLRNCMEMLKTTYCPNYKLYYYRLFIEFCLFRSRSSSFDDLDYSDPFLPRNANYNSNSNRNITRTNNPIYATSTSSTSNYGVTTNTLSFFRPRSDEDVSLLDSPPPVNCRFYKFVWVLWSVVISVTALSSTALVVNGVHCDCVQERPCVGFLSQVDSACVVDLDHLSHI